MQKIQKYYTMNTKNIITKMLYVNEGLQDTLHYKKLESINY